MEIKEEDLKDFEEEEKRYINSDEYKLLQKEFRKWLE